MMRPARGKGRSASAEMGALVSFPRLRGKAGMGARR